MTVEIKMLNSKKEFGIKELSNFDIEFHFIKNVLAYMIENVCSRKPKIDVYYDYLKLIAISPDLCHTENVVGILDKWLVEFFIPNANKSAHIVLKASNDVFYTSL